jgi:cytoskeleton protein RodZ
LRKARQLKGEDLAQISRVLKIRKDHLDALEESNFDALPGRAYTIGFVRSYASYLGLDPKACITRLKAEIAGRGEAKEGPVPVSAPRDRKLPQGTVIFAVILIIAVIYGIYYLIVAVNRLANQPVPRCRRNWLRKRD